MQSIQRRDEEPFIFRLLEETFDEESHEPTDITPIENRTITLLMAIFAIAACLFGLASGVIPR